MESFEWEKMELTAVLELISKIETIASNIIFIIKTLVAKGGILHAKKNKSLRQG